MQSALTKILGRKGFELAAQLFASASFQAEQNRPCAAPHALQNGYSSFSLGFWVDLDAY